MPRVGSSPHGLPTIAIMTDDDPFRDRELTDDQFDALLGQLLDAWASGLDLRGTHAYRNGPDAPDWEVQAVELEKRGSTE